MKICVTAINNTLESQVDPRFGRCNYFMLIDTDTMAFEPVSNNTQAAGGAGIQAATLMSEKGVVAVLTGNTGPNAHQTLQAAGIAIYTAVSGSVSEAVEKFKKGMLKTTDRPTVDSHFGLKGDG